jgi:hypothetical protein
VTVTTSAAAEITDKSKAIRRRSFDIRSPQRLLLVAGSRCECGLNCGYFSMCLIGRIAEAGRFRSA